VGISGYHEHLVCATPNSASWMSIIGHGGKTVCAVAEIQIYMLVKDH